MNITVHMDNSNSITGMYSTVHVGMLNYLASVIESVSTGEFMDD